jgi:stage II sporulation protein M
MFNNILVAFIAFLGGILTLDLAAAFLLFINGVILGASAAVALDRMPAGEVLVKIVPHGLFEVPALLLAGAGGFLSLKLVLALLKERKIDYRRELVNAGRLAVAVVLLLAVAGVVEAHLTPALAAWLYSAGE